ncbi:MAG: heavy metal translocating P-type ATPase [Alphaproteobacteria bacterium]
MTLEAATASLDWQPVAGFVRSDGEVRRLELLVDGAHCGGCLTKIERALKAEPDVEHARLNLSTRRLALRWRGAPARGDALAQKVRDLGYGVAPFDVSLADTRAQAEERSLLRALAVAGFATGNVMLFSVAIWAGHGQGMSEETRSLLHWFSALIALPAVAYAAGPFYRSAWAALRVRRTNMDVPITLGVLIASAISLHETILGNPHAYFDSAVTLLFFLLIGRFLDRRARRRARSAAEVLLAMQARAVTILGPGEVPRSMRADEVEPGMVALVAAGERIGVDGMIVAGRSDIDASAISGESTPQAMGPGDPVYAGMVSTSGPLRVRAAAVGPDTLLGDIVRLLEAAEQRKSRFVDLADRIARLYAPMVHSFAALTFFGWWLIGGIAWQPALLIAVAVLIVTCPCALGLAVPAVQVIANGRLMKRGVLVKSGSALERLAKADTIVFDKTGTLTLGEPHLTAVEPPDSSALGAAGRLAAMSRHPLARALCAAAGEVVPAQGVSEQPGLGLVLATAEGEVRLGSREWCGVKAPPSDRTEMWLTRPGAAPVRFTFADTPRTDAAEVVATLARRGYRIALLSGDRRGAVAGLAAELGIVDWRAELRPAEKCAALETMRADGRRPLMVGDGINDAPALAAAYVSISPASGTAITQTAADLVFQGRRLAPVLDALEVARNAERLVRQNLFLAFAYNAITVPIAMAGLVTPLVAAIAMSSSSILVVGNALRLGWRRAGRPWTS